MSDATPAETPKPDEPKGWMDKIGAALPIGLTALATVFAGVASDMVRLRG